MKNLNLFFIFSILVSGCVQSTKKVEPVSTPKINETTSATFQWTDSRKIKFHPFTIQKITSAGIQSVRLTSTNDKSWPQIENTKLTSLKNLAKKTNRLRFVVLGDTGCRLKVNNTTGVYQDCSQPNEWPYPVVAQTIAKEKSDFYIHTGDYHYREQCIDAQLCPSYTKSLGYGWNAWWDDFYEPSQILFKKKPWVFIRGNHEDCQRAYTGWTPLSPTQKDFSESDCQEIEPYQWIELGSLVLINFDDSAFEERKKLTDVEIQKWTQKLVEIKNRIQSQKGKKEFWFLSHKPTIGYINKKAENGDYQRSSENLLNLMKTSGLYEEIDLFLSGHIHNQQIARDTNKDHVIVGNSGSALDFFNEKVNRPFLISTTSDKYKFGYAVFERSGYKKWKFIFKNKKGETDLVCHQNKKEIECGAF